MTACLGRRVAELADGRLSGPERERALAHVASCASCRDALEVQRSIRDRLSSARTPVLPADLSARLMGVPQSPGTTWPVIDLAAQRRHRRRGAMAGGAVVVGVVAVFGGMTSFAQTATSVPTVTPNLPVFAVHHAAITSGVPHSGEVKDQPGRSVVERVSVQQAALLDPTDP